MTTRIVYLLTLATLAPAANAAPIVEQDWYFRESLSAIRDWETILARCEAAKDPVADVPAMPVPDAAEAIWTNPIPPRLMPAGWEAESVAVRRVDGATQVQRGAAEWQACGDGAEVVGYQHPGGGDKDRWYHAYFRRFDALTRFRPTAAPIALRVEPPQDWSRGANTVSLSIVNASDSALDARVAARLLLPDGDSPCPEQQARLTPGGSTEMDLTVELQHPGGAVFVIEASVGEQTWRVPLLTCVEDVDAVLNSVVQILGDAPDSQGQTEWRALRDAVAAWRPGAREAGQWRELFLAASALRDRLLLSRIDFDSLLFIKRKPFDSEQPYMDAHHLHNRPGGGIYRLSPVRPDGALEPLVTDLGEGVYRDLCLHWDADRAVFSFGNGSDDWDGSQSYHIYEVSLRDGAVAQSVGRSVHQLTRGEKNDCEPFYLPNGQIGFTSDRSEHIVMCGGDRHVANLFIMEGDGASPRQLSFNVFNDFNPSVLDDGRILYSRWEYNERSVTSLHNPFTIEPSGRMMRPYYGNATIRPNVVMFPRQIPGSRKVLGLFTAHHGQTHGPIGIIDTAVGMDGPEPLTVLTPGVPITGEKHEDSTVGWFSDPRPLTEATYLCSYTPTCVPWRENTWAVYIGDQHGNLALVYRAPEISCQEPVPLVATKHPMVLPSADPGSERTDGTAELILLDVTKGLGDVPLDACRYLRVLEDVPRKSVHHGGGVICTSNTSIYTIKRILGTVPIEPDGSARFSVPANRNVYFEVLDGDGLEVQRMRSVVCLKPGEKQTCVGCHEPRTTAPPNLFASATWREPSTPTPPPWGDRTISFLRDVQPILNEQCVRCHAYDRRSNGVVLTDDLTPQFTIGYEELVRHIAFANAMRWDNPDDVYARPAYTYGSGASPLVRLLREGHHGVELTSEQWRALTTWVDANGVYYDTYASAYGPSRDIFDGETRKQLREVYDRRCATCHGGSEDQIGIWWQSLNRRDPASSRFVAAPLARSAGGWQRCGEAVFADASDPDYVAARGALEALARRLTERPREDLASVLGTDVERQVVVLPAPPEPGPVRIVRTDEGWVALSDMEWTSASAGWTGNGDLLPRKDNDVEGHTFRLDMLRCPRGLGTHAPSDIRYALDGGYTRLRATAQAAEAGGTVRFRVLADGRCVFESAVLRGPNETAEADIDVSGVAELRLVVDDAGDGINADMANWLNAELLPGRQ